MKKIIFTFFLFIIGLTGYSQTMCNYYKDSDGDGFGSSNPADAISIPCTIGRPTGYVSNNLDCDDTIANTTPCSGTPAAGNVEIPSDKNYIITKSYKKASASSISNPTPDKVNVNIAYFDGLGRPIQSIAKQKSASGKDIVTAIEYDIVGRQDKEYLSIAGSTSNISFDPNAIANTLSYYGTPNSAQNGNPNPVESTTNPYSKKLFESSPLNRVLQQVAPGNDWKLGSGHEIKLSYQTNTTNEVKLFVVNTVWDTTLEIYDVSLVDKGYYASNELIKVVTYDENTAASPLEINGSTVEFKNKLGQVVLKRTYDGQVKNDTYYVYNNYGNLTYVIPPKAVDLLDENTGSGKNITSALVITASSSSLYLRASNSIRLLDGFHAQAGSTFSATIDGNQPILDELCYQYKYDHRNRLVEKKLPAKQWEFIVYDKLDRVVATGPSNSPFSDITSVGWLITKYDVFNRTILTAWLPATITATTRKALQTTQNNFTGNFSETKIETSEDNIIPPALGVAFRYTNVAWPISGYHIMTVNYYDDYNFPNAPTIGSTVADGDQKVFYTNTIKPKGLATGSWIRVLETSTSYRNEQNYSLYDAKARIVRSYKKNFLEGYTFTDNIIDEFSGQLKYSITKHSRLKGGPELKTKDVFTYSDQDRLISQTHQINDAQTSELLFTNSYDELGQLISKKVGNTETLPVQNVNYSYNIRGWLTGINDITSLTKSGDPKDLFAFKINYNTATSGISDVLPLYNGNISETYWATNSDNGIVRSYGYRYDKLNRLKDAIFKTGTTLSNTYNEAITYDKNGNIQTLKRNGLNLSGNGYALIDDLVYSYQNNNTSNRLMKVVDSASDSYKTEGFKDSVANIVDDYSYDVNGNMIKDNNKNIASIIYNHLNLPTKISFVTGESLVYTYNAIGQKVQKIMNSWTASQADTRTTDYLGGYQYEALISPVQGSFSSKLLFFPTAAGYVEPVGSSYKYIYQYKDHLGNIRLSYDKNLVIQEENNYYAFGLKQYGYNNVNNSSNAALRYKYNGKELQDELGLNMYDYGARNYDPALGRWMNIDPLAETSRRFSPYTYALNNPIYFIDPDGMQARYNWEEHDKGNKGVYTDDETKENVSFEEALSQQNNKNDTPPRTIFVNGYLFGGMDGGKKYWSREFRNGATKYFTKNTEGLLETYINHDPDGFSSAEERFEDGYNYAFDNYFELTQGMNKKDDYFNFVSHSMGSAYAEGIAKYMIEMGWKIGTVVHINAFQAADIISQKNFSFKDRTKTIDYQNTDDPVINNPIRSSPGDIQGADEKIRVNSGVKAWDWIHASPIGSGVNFWQKLNSLMK